MDGGGTEGGREWWTFIRFTSSEKRLLERETNGAKSSV